MMLYSLIDTYLQRHVHFSCLQNSWTPAICHILYYFSSLFSCENRAFFHHTIFCPVLFGQALFVSHLSLLISFSLMSCPLLDVFTLWLGLMSTFKTRSWIQQNLQGFYRAIFLMQCISQPNVLLKAKWNT